mmetsp:Transcript_2318/g.3625  ORF Transcript_2318/g.3625 Transcript_2318/m.3625 type:complete len:157 (+) Transcript_2318:1-471(+)
MSFKVWAGVVSQKAPSWGDIIKGGVERALTEAEQAAYNAPFPSEEFKSASREFPRLVPQFDDHGSVEENKGAWRRIFERWNKPFLTLFSDKDPVSKGGELIWQKKVPGAQGRSHCIIEDAGHFLQEDKPQELVAHLKKFILENPVPLNPCVAFSKL